MMELKIKRIPDAAGRVPPMPQYATPGAAAMDLTAFISQPCMLESGARARIPTGIAIALPDAAHAAFVFARSGLAVRGGIALSNGVGVIDSDYRGEIKVGLVNLGSAPYTINPGDRIAQLCVMPVVQPALVETDDLDQTARGAGGFGSTGR